MSQFDWPITQKKKGKKKLWRIPKIEGFILKSRVSPLWPTYIGERRTTFGKAYRIKMRCYAEHVGGTHWKPGEHIGNLMGTHWKPKGNTLGTREKWEKFPCLKINF